PTACYPPPPAQGAESLFECSSNLLGRSADRSRRSSRGRTVGAEPRADHDRGWEALGKPSARHSQFREILRCDYSLAPARQARKPARECRRIEPQQSAFG